MVAPATARSTALKELLYEMAASNSKVTFVLLVPVPDPASPLSEAEASQELARLAAEEDRSLLIRAHVNVVGARVGAQSVPQAIDDELRANEGAYDGVILCTIPQRVTNSEGFAVPEATTARYGIPLIRISAETAE